MILRRILALALVVVAVAACGGDDDGDDQGLRDGTHVGAVRELDVEVHRLSFDEVEVLSGPAAVRAAQEDGERTTETGTYVRNADDTATIIDIDENVVVRLLVPCCQPHEASLEEWRAGFVGDERTFYGTSRSYYEVTVRDGKVVRVDEVRVD